MYFKDKKILITGAAKGIGRAITEDLVNRGGQVIIVDIDSQAAKELATGIEQKGGSVFCFNCDISQDDQVASLYKNVIDQVGVPDIVINNAYARHKARGDVDELILDDFQQAFDINTLGPLRLIKAFLPAMAKHGNAHIVDTASSLVITPNADAQRMLPYMASKGAILGLAYALRYRLAQKNVSYSLFCPGLTDTRPADQPAIAEFPENAKPASYAAKVLLEGIEKGDFLISSEPDFEKKLVTLASNRLDPLAQ